MGKIQAAAFLLQLAAGPAAAASDIPKAVVVVESLTAALPDQVPEAAPPRFVLLEDGQVFVGGTSRLAAGRLSKTEAKDIEARVVAVRQLPGFGASVTLGAGPQRYRLRLRKGGAQDITVAGDPAGPEAPANLQPVAALLNQLLSFDHPSLRPYRPASYAVIAREGKIAGGCRRWTFPDPVSESLFAPRTVPAAGAEGWPTGAVPASVCAGDKTYVVALRPLLPGERP
jgi:hypothetical protein